MGKVQPDGSVIESNLTLVQISDVTKHIAQHRTNNYSIKEGQVIEILYPEHERNLSKYFIEYTVYAMEKLPDKSISMVTYNNCRASIGSGTLYNRTNFTFKVGAHVILQCLNGLASGGSAIIVGALDAPGAPKYSAADGQFYDFNFNGIRQYINKNGEYVLSFTSPYDDKGKLTNEKASGTYLKIDKDGKFSIFDNEKQGILIDRVNKSLSITNGADSIKIDKANKSISVLSSDTISVKSKGATSMSSASMDASTEKDYNVEAGSNIGMRAKANVAMKADASFNINAGAQFQAKAGAVATVEAGTMANIKAPIVNLGAGGFPIGIAGISISIGSDSHGVPVISTLLTGSLTSFAGT